MFPDLIEKLRRRVDLTEGEAASAMAAIMDGSASPAEIAGFLVGLVMKGERPDEIVGLARTMRERAVKLPAPPVNCRASESLDWTDTAHPGACTWNDP